MLWLAPFLFLSSPGPQAQGMVLPTGKMGLSTALNATKIIPDKHAQRPASRDLLLHSIKLTETIRSLYRRLPPAQHYVSNIHTAHVYYLLSISPATEY